MKQLTIVLLSVLLFTSCATLKSSDFRKVELGMSKDKTLKTLGKNYDIVSAKRYDDGTLEIYQYKIASGDSINPAKYNWLFFFNDELDQWGPKESYIPFDNNKDYRRNKNKR